VAVIDYIGADWALYYLAVHKDFGVIDSRTLVVATDPSDIHWPRSDYSVCVSMRYQDFDVLPIGTFCSHMARFAFVLDSAFF